MKTVIFLAALLLAANAFSFGSVFHKVENAATQAVSGVKNAATQVASGVQNAATQVASGVQNAASQVESGVQNAASQVASGVQNAASSAEHAATDAGDGAVHIATEAGHGITYAAQSFASHIATLPGDMKNKFQFVGSQIQNLAQKGATIASDVSQQIAADATQDIEEAAQAIVDNLGIALECAEVVLENAQLFSTCAAIADDPSELIANWNDIDNELYNICVGCSGQPASKFQWLKEIQLGPKDMAIIKCTSDAITLGEAAGEIAASDGVDVPAVISLINGIISLATDCPTAIQYVESFITGSAPISQKLESGFFGSQSQSQSQ